MASNGGISKAGGRFSFRIAPAMQAFSSGCRADKSLRLPSWRGDSLDFIETGARYVCSQATAMHRGGGALANRPGCENVPVPAIA